MEFPKPSIPLRLSIDFGGDFGDEDVHEHEIRFHVAGAPESQVVAIVQTDPVILPRVLRYRRRGALDLVLFVSSREAHKRGRCVERPPDHLRPVTHPFPLDDWFHD